jgi:glutathione S-transferase
MRGAKADMSKERSTLETAYHMVERQIMSKIWIAGKEFSMADCAAAPAPFFCQYHPAVSGRVQPLEGLFRQAGGETIGPTGDRRSQAPAFVAYLRVRLR